jgi:hypothetical protein
MNAGRTGIRQSVAAFLTTIIITIVILNTGKWNTAVREQGTPTPQRQPEQCTCKQAKDQHEGARKQFNRADKEDSRSMDNGRNETGKTAQTSIINQYRQSKDRYELDRIINHYKELDTRTDSRPKQHKDKPRHNKMGTLITAKARYG